MKIYPTFIGTLLELTLLKRFLEEVQEVLAERSFGEWPC